MHYGRIDLGEGIYVIKSKSVKNVLSVTIGVLIMGSNFKIIFDDVVLFCCICCIFFVDVILIISDITIITVKGIGYHWIIYDINKCNIIYLLENSVLDDHGYI